MMTYKAFWTQTAQRDLRRIIEHIGADSEAKARSVYSTVKQKADDLRRMPLQGRIVPELSYHCVYIYRELIIPPWRIIYKIDDDKVLVIAVIDGRRNVEDILLGRFI